MTRLTTPSRTRALFGGVAILSALLLSVPKASAQLATWAYPNTPAERTERLQTIRQQLRILDQSRESQLVVRTEAEDVLVKLVDELQTTEADLVAIKAPLDRALEKYRQAQEVALVDTMIDLEAQRLAYVQIETEVVDDIRAIQEKVDYLNQLIAQATEKLTLARQGMNATLQQIENLWQRQENIVKIVFLRSMSD